MPEYCASSLPLSVSIAGLSDLPAIVSIYNQAVSIHRSTANITPVTVEGRKAWFLEHAPDIHPIFIAKINDQTAGWCSRSSTAPGKWRCVSLQRSAAMLIMLTNTRAWGVHWFAMPWRPAHSLESRISLQSSLTAMMPAAGYLKKWAFNSGAICRVYWISMARSLESIITGSGSSTSFCNLDAFLSQFLLIFARYAGYE